MPLPAWVSLKGMPDHLCFFMRITSILVVSIREPHVTFDRPTNRVEAGVIRGEPFAFTLNGRTMQAFPGETIASALLAANVRTLRKTEKSGAPRGMFCGMGICFDCLITVDGRPHLRACLTEVKPGMDVTVQDEAAWREGRG